MKAHVSHGTPLAAGRLLAAVMAITLSTLLGACERNTGGTAGSDSTEIGSSADTVIGTLPTGNELSSTSGSTPEVPVATSRDADQAFLHRMLDHHEATVAIAHDAMMSTGGHTEHGRKADPAEFDASLDAEKREMLALLDTLYHEQYSPVDRRSRTQVLTARSPESTTRTTGAANTAPGETAEMATMMASRQALAHQFQDGIALVDQSARQLRRPSVRALAARIRASELVLLGNVKSAPQMNADTR